MRVILPSGNSELGRADRLQKWYHMASAKDYRHYAQQCLRYADETENDEDREIFLEMAKVWTQLELTSAPADIAQRKE